MSERGSTPEENPEIGATPEVHDDAPTPAPTAEQTGQPPRPGPRYWLALILVGALGGLLSGLFGVGGGILMVPLLIGIVGLTQKQASATSLTAIVPTAIAGSATYGLAGQVELIPALLLAIGGVGGSFLGAMLLRRIPMGVLRWLFIALLVVVAVRMALIAPVRGEDVELTWGPALGLVAIGVAIGIASGLFGIGGGVIAVPALIALFGFGDLAAKGTSLLMMIPTALMGTIPNLRARLVDLRVAGVVGISAVAASFGGVALAFLIPATLSGIIFAALLVVSAIQLAIRAIRTRKNTTD